VTVRRLGTQKHYQANLESPLFSELTSIARKTVGIAELLRDALAPLASRVIAAFVYGSVAKRRDKAASDIDLMVVSDSLTYADDRAALGPQALEMGALVLLALASQELGMLVGEVRAGAAASRHLERKRREVGVDGLHGSGVSPRRGAGRRESFSGTARERACTVSHSPPYPEIRRRPMEDRVDVVRC
jgi:predicted nucleotidyltransferase